MSRTELEPLRFSRLKKMAKSAAHYLAAAEEDTGPLRKGSGLHSVLIGDASRVVVYKGGKRDLRTKAYQEFLAAHPDDTQILSPSEFKDVEGMRRSIEKHPRAMQLLEGIREQRITWKIGHRECSGTPDVVRKLGPGRYGVVELKSGQSAAPDLFKWQAKKLCYQGQLAWYANGVESTMLYPPGKVEELHIVAVESTAPYPVTVFRVDESMRKLGDRQVRMWFEQLMVCEQTGHFPGYVESDVDWADDDTELEWDDEEAA